MGCCEPVNQVFVRPTSHNNRVDLKCRTYIVGPIEKDLCFPPTVVYFNPATCLWPSQTIRIALNLWITPTSDFIAYNRGDVVHEGGHKNPFRICES